MRQEMFALSIILRISEVTVSHVVPILLPLLESTLGAFDISQEMQIFQSDGESLTNVIVEPRCLPN